MLPGHTAYIRDIRFSPDGSRLLSASDFPENIGTALGRGHRPALNTLAGHKNSFGHAFSAPTAGGSHVVDGPDRRLWNGAGEPMAVLGGHTGWVTIPLQPEQYALCHRFDDATLRLWNARTGELIAVLRGHGVVVLPAGLHTRRRRWCPAPRMARCASGTWVWWNESAPARARDLCLRRAFSPDGEQVASRPGTARTPLGRHVRPSNRFAQARKEHRRQRDIQPRRPAAGDGERDRGITLWDVASQKVARTWMTATL